MKDKALIILFTTTSAQFLMPFMMAGVNAILPSIGADTHASAMELSLLITFYALGLTMFQLTAGRMGDIWGRRRIFLWGICIFTLTTMLVGFINNIYILLLLRIAQATGSAMFSASGLAILAVSTPSHLLGRYVGFSAMAVYAGIACGPPIAGIIAGTIGWRWLFWGTALASLVPLYCMRFVIDKEWYQGRGEPFDWKGSIFFGLSMTSFTIGCTIIQKNLPLSLILMGIGIVLFIIYIRMELHTPYPILDIRLLVKNKLFALSSLAAFINFSSCFGMLFFFGIYLQLVRNLSAMQAGLFLSLQFVVQTLVTPYSSTLSERYGAGRISAIGITFTGLGLCSSAFLGLESHLGFFVFAQVVLGIGMGLFAAPNTTVMLESVDEAHVGQAASVSGTMRTAGGLLNTTIISITLGFFLGDAPVSQENIDDFLHSMRVDLILFGLLNIAAIGCALGRGFKMK